MQINQIIMHVMALGALIGGIDLILGNRFGYGERFEEAFRLLGPIGLSMAGIICLVPVISGVLGKVIVPLFSALRLDPGMFGGILAIDMGGYPLAMELAADPEIGKFSGIIVSAVFGCTIIFTIPVGLSIMGEEDRPYFTKGILWGMVSMPGAIILGGLITGLPLGKTLRNILPVLLVSALLFWGITRKPEAIARGFQCFAKLIRAIATLGLMLGAVQYMTGWQLMEGFTPLAEAMEVVCSIAIVMLGSMPLAELLRRILKVPFSWIGKHTGLNSASTTGILIGMVSVAPALASVPRMDRRGKVVNGAFLVCGASTFAAHLGFTVTAQPEMVPALLTVKLLGGLAGALIAFFATNNMKETNT